MRVLRDYKGRVDELGAAIIGVAAGLVVVGVVLLLVWLI